MEIVSTDYGIENYDNIIEETKTDLDNLKNDIEQEDPDPRIEIIKNNISGIKSFDDFPIILNYQPIESGRTSKEILPTKMDIRPKPSNKKRYIDGEEVKSPNPLIIILDDRKFSITPDIGSIKNIYINNGNIKIETTLKNEIYNPERMAKLLLILRRYKGVKGKDISGTPRAKTHEIK